MTVTVNANLHRILSESQRAVPAEVRSRAPENPLAFAVVLLCAVRDFGLAVVQFLGAAITWLTRLLEALEEQFGKDWVRKLDLPPLFPGPAK